MIDPEHLKTFFKLLFGRTQGWLCLAYINPESKTFSEKFFQDYPHLAFYPAICIIIVALGFTLMGESLREALDPKSRR